MIKNNLHQRNKKCHVSHSHVDKEWFTCGKITVLQNSKGGPLRGCEAHEEDTRKLIEE